MLARIFGLSIRSRVMKAINRRIEIAQKKFLQDCIEIDKRVEMEKEALADKLVTDILGR